MTCDLCRRQLFCEKGISTKWLHQCRNKYAGWTLSQLLETCSNVAIMWVYHCVTLVLQAGWQQIGPAQLAHVLTSTADWSFSCSCGFTLVSNWWPWWFFLSNGFMFLLKIRVMLILWILMIQIFPFDFAKKKFHWKIHLFEKIQYLLKKLCWVSTTHWPVSNDHIPQH